MKLNKFVIFLIITASILVLHTSRADTNKQYKIAMIPKGSTQIFWKSVHEGAVKAAQEENVNLIWMGPEKEDDVQRQKQFIEKAIDEKADAIVLAPADYEELVGMVNEADDKSIRSIIIDSSMKGDNFISLIATDNFNSGRLCAQELAKSINNRGNVIMLRYFKGSASTDEREEGFLDEIRKYKPEIMVISSDVYGGSSERDCYREAVAMLKKYDNIDGIFCPNELTTLGMLKALQLSGKAGKIKFVGFDLSYAIRDALSKGEINGLALQDPVKMGYMGVKTAVMYLQGKQIDKRIDTGVRILTTEQLNDISLTSRILYCK